MKQGLYKDFYDTDQLLREGTCKDDKKDGFFKEYSLDGRVVRKEEYRMGELVVKEEDEKDKFGSQARLLRDRAVKIVGTYKKGVPEGVLRKYDEQGNIDSAKVSFRRTLIAPGQDGQSGPRAGRVEGVLREWKAARDR